MLYSLSLYICVYAHTGVCERHGQLRVLTHIYIIFCLSQTHIYIYHVLSLYFITHTRAHTQAFGGNTANYASAHLKARIYCVETNERVEMIQV